MTPNIFIQAIKTWFSLFDLQRFISLPGLVCAQVYVMPNFLI